MKRKTTARNLVLEKMNYSNPDIVSRWKKRFSDKEPSRQKRAERKAPAKMETGKPDGPAIALIQKTPLVFRLERRENPQDFERMAFVVRACSKDRPGLKVLHIEQTKTGSRLVGCDGRRLHVAEISQKIKSGDYKAVMTKEAVGLAKSGDGFLYPNWINVVPSKIGKRGFINLENSGFGKNREETEKLSIAFNSFVRQTGETVNLRYIEDLSKKHWAIYCQDGKGKAVVLKEKGAEDAVYAVIMPLTQEVNHSAVAA
jgi:hypothetical protein